MDGESLRFFDPLAETRKTANKLPHWQQPGATYFITFRLADAVPAALREQWVSEKDAWLANHPRPWTAATEKEYHRRFSARMESWLDAGHGECILRDPENRGCVEATLRHLDGAEYLQHAWVLMPNHVHVLVSFKRGATLEKVLKAWKSVSARKINERRGRTGTLWQEDYFDRLVRDGGHFENCVRYIRRNPEKVNLREGEFTFFESEWVKGMVP